MIFPRPIHILAAQRSPIGRFGGAFQEVSAVTLATEVAQAVLRPCSGLVPDQVIVGQALPAGTGMNLARQLVMHLKLKPSVPGFTVSMACGSGLQSVVLAASAIGAGDAQVVLSGGAENMSRAPFLDVSSRWQKKAEPAMLTDSIQCDGLSDPYLNIGMGETAERIADRFKINRHEQDSFALSSQQRAGEASGDFKREIVAITTGQGRCERDEHPRSGITLEKLATLKPSFREKGTVTAGNSSGINDGAALVLLASAEAMKRNALSSRARVVGAQSIGCDPSMMGLGPVAAVQALCGELSWNLSEVPAVEINEAFAAQTLACIRELGLKENQVNLRGGAIALGHPIGCSGARILVTLLHLLEDRGWQRGIASLCVGGGMGIALAVERD
jgi:acetyl-CoA C-acetyltransferase